MSDERLLIIVILLCAAGVSLLLSFIAWKRRSSTGRPATYFSLCMAAVSLYSFGYAMELSSSSLPEVMFWVRFEHWGTQAVAPTWLLFAVYLTGNQKLITPGRKAVLFIIPVLLLVAAQTLGGHNVWHHKPGLNTAGPFPTFTYQRGLVAWLGIIYASLCLAFSTILFILTLFRAAPAFRKQAVILLAGSLIPWLGMLLYNLRLTAYNLDYAPLALCVTGLVVALGFLKFRLLDIVPLARDVVFEGMSDGVLVLDTGNRIIDFNPRLQAILSSVRPGSVGLPAFDELADYPVLVELIKADSSSSVELQVNGSGTNSCYQCSLTPLFDWNRKQVGKIVTLHDHTQVKQLLERLEELATRDALTGAYNRRYFNELATREVYRIHRYGGVLSLIMLDIDHFKRVNDTHGHMAGDAALRTVAQTCSRLLRQSDILCRFGGEEFVILLPQTDQTAASVFAEKLRKELEEQRIRYEDRSFVVTASFGVAGMTAASDAALEDLLRSADAAVYEAKEAGRNRVCLSNARRSGVQDG